jgi:hypothetical protein
VPMHIGFQHSGGISKHTVHIFLKILFLGPEGQCGEHCGT